MSTATDYVQPSAIIERGGQRIGVIGIDIARKTLESSSPDPSTQILNEVIAAQLEIGRLQAQGVDKIVVLSHYQYQNDLALAASLSGVDVIVGGDSHTLLAPDLAQVGLGSLGPYPTQVSNRDGDQVCVVHAWEHAKVLGELTVSFDDEGRVMACEGQPHLLIVDSFQTEKRRERTRRA